MKRQLPFDDDEHGDELPKSLSSKERQTALVIESAPLWVRAAAFLFDLILLAALCAVGAWSLQAILADWGVGTIAAGHVEQMSPSEFGVAEEAPVRWAIIAVSALCVLAVTLVYFAISESSYHRASPGKLVAGLRVVRTGGGKLDFRQALWRAVCAVPTVLAFGAGFFAGTRHPELRTTYDRLSGSRVIKEGPLQWAQALRIIGLLVFVTISLAALSDFIKRYDLLHGKTDDSKEAQKTLPPLPAPSPVPAMELVVAKNLAGRSLQFSGTVIRLQDPMLPRDYYEAVPEEGEPRLLELALYPKRLTNEELERLRDVPSLRTDSQSAVGQEPGLVVELIIPYRVIGCDPTKLDTGRLYFNEKNFGFGGPHGEQWLEVPISPADLARDHYLFMNCDSLQLGSSLFLSVQATLGSKKDGNEIAPKFNIDGPIIAFRNLPIVMYDSYGDALALWDAARGTLSVGFFDQPLRELDIQAIKEKRALSGSRRAPRAAAVIPLRPGSKSASVDEAKQGYTMTIRSDQRGSIPWPSDAGEQEIGLTPGLAPTTLTGALRPGSRIIGRLEGRQVVTFPKSNIDFRWALAFNAPLVLLP